MTRNYNDYIPPTEKAVDRNSSGRLRLTRRGRIITTSVVFVTAGAGATVGAGYIIDAQHHQLEKSNRIVAQLTTSPTTFGTPAPAVPTTAATSAPIVPTVTRTIKAPAVTRTIKAPTVTVTREAKTGAHIPPPSETFTRYPSASITLEKLLPYYNEEAPAWCLEDMACWIGSKADGRTDAQILMSLKCDLLGSSYNYSNTDAGFDPDDFKGC